MPTYVALLRGINVGGKRSLPMATLRAAVEEAGATNVQTYIQSGNVVLAHASRAARKLTAQLETAIADAAGFDVPVVLRTAAEWGAVIERNPFAGEAEDHLHCGFLPAAPAGFDFDLGRFAPERCALVDRELYLYLPSGIGSSKLATMLFRQRALAAATARNWRTVLKLQDLASA